MPVKSFKASIGSQPFWMRKPAIFMLIRSQRLDRCFQIPEWIDALAFAGCNEAGEDRIRFRPRVAADQRQSNCTQSRPWYAS